VTGRCRRRQLHASIRDRLKESMPDRQSLMSRHGRTLAGPILVKLWPVAISESIRAVPMDVPFGTDPPSAFLVMRCAGLSSCRQLRRPAEAPSRPRLSGNRHGMARPALPRGFFSPYAPNRPKSDAPEWPGGWAWACWAPFDSLKPADCPAVFASFSRSGGFVV